MAKGIPVVARSPRLAATWFTLAADRGFAPARRELAALQRRDGTGRTDVAEPLR